MTFQCNEMDNAIELLQKFNEVLYDEGYHTSDKNIQWVIWRNSSMERKG